jgi:hypothetical protein
MEFDFSIEKLFNIQNGIKILQSDCNKYYSTTDINKLSLIIDTIGIASSKVNIT